MLIEWKKLSGGFWRLYIAGELSYWGSVECTWTGYIARTSPMLGDNRFFWRLKNAKVYVEAMYWLRDGE